MALPSPRPQAAWPNAARREQREEGREQKADSSIRSIFTVSRGQVEKVLKIRKVHPHRITPYLRCPVTTSKSVAKYLSSLLPTVCKSGGASKRLAKHIRRIFTVFRDHVVEGKKVFKQNHSKLRGFFEKLFSASRSSDGGPRVPRRGPQARLTPFLQGEIRRPESLHIYSPRRHFCS